MNDYENKSCRVFLKTGRDKSVRNFHPWIFSGAVKNIEGDFRAGDIVSVFSAESEFLAKGFLNSHSQIIIRVLSFEEAEINDQFFLERISTSFRWRKNFPVLRSTACRLINGDGDSFPGLVVDRYNNILVFQIFSLGMDRLRQSLQEWLDKIYKPEAIVERSEGISRQEENLTAVSGLVSGRLPPELIIEENGIKYLVDVLKGQKTGFFLDQRDNRFRIAGLSEGRKVLNCFSYTGGFSLAAARNGAETTSVDVSHSAVEAAIRNFSLNGLDPATHRFEEMNAFDFLHKEKERYDLIILDPPAFVKRRNHLKKGARAYQEINRMALKLLSSEGLLLTCSCSAHVSWDLFQKILFTAAKESGRYVSIVGKFSQPVDHPVSIYHPEGEYLKSFLLRAL